MNAVLVYVDGLRHMLVLETGRKYVTLMDWANLTVVRLPVTVDMKPIAFRPRFVASAIRKRLRAMKRHAVEHAVYNLTRDGHIPTPKELAAAGRTKAKYRRGQIKAVLEALDRSTIKDCPP